MQMSQAEANKILEKYGKFKEILSRDYDSIWKLKKDIWKIVLDISQKVSSLVEWKNEISGAEAEDMWINSLRNWAKWSDSILEIEEILNLFSKKGEEILEKKKIYVPFSFFKSKGNPSINWEKSGNLAENKFSTAPKYKTVLNVLSDLWIDFDKVKISEESLDEEKNWEWEEKPQIKKRRKVPYLSIEVKDKQKNLNIIILVCDEVGQSTFIYDGTFQIEELKNTEKEEKINWFSSHTIPYDEENFYEKLKAKIEFLSFKRFERDEYKEEFRRLWVDEKAIQEDSSAIGKFRLFFDKFLWEWEKKSWIAVEKIDGEEILFIPFRWLSRDLILWWKRLASSPSEAFNQKYFKRDKHKTRDDVIKMLDFLSYKVANDDQMKQRWKKIIEENTKSFEEIGVYNKGWIWYFWNLHCSPEKLVIGWYNINYFRPSEFKDSNWKKITAVYDNNLKFLFESLGFTIASEEQEKAKFVEILRNEYFRLEEDFKKRWIVFQKGKWYICWKKPYPQNRKSKEIVTNNKSSDHRWGELVVNGKYFKYFPSIDFNKKSYNSSENLKSYGIMKSKDDLKIILQALWETVATEEEAKTFFPEHYEKVA